MADAVIKRLEAVAARLEAYASGLPAKSAPTEQKTGGASTGGSSAGAAAYSAWQSQHLSAFVAACGKFKELNQVGEWAKTIYDRVGQVVSASANAKKPSDSELMKFLEPVNDVAKKAGNPDNRSPYFNQLKAFSESIPATWWVASPSPKDNINDALEAADFYLIKVLKDGKTKNDDNWSSFASTMKTMLLELKKMVLSNYPTGLQWNPSGSSLAEAAGGASSSSSSSSGAGAPPPPRKYSDALFHN